RMLQSLARLIQAVTDGALVICLDQLEDIHGMDEAATRFRRAVQTIVTLAEIPNVVVVLSCLGEFYALLKENLPKSHLDRLEMDPLPVTLKAQRIEEEIQQILSRRLQYLFELTDTPFADDSSIFPFPAEATRRLDNRTTRDVLEWCRRKREESIATGKEPTLDDGVGPVVPETSDLSRFWSDHLTKNVDLPEADHEYLALIGQSIEHCGQELGNGYHFHTQFSGDYLTTTVQAASESITEALLLGMCQKSAVGGALAKQIEALEETAGDQVPVVLRTTDFPSNPKTKIAQQIGQFITAGGRRAQVADSDWRAMIAMQSFAQQYNNHPDYEAWLQAEQPLSQLPSLQQILDLKNLQTTIPPKWNGSSPTTATGAGSAPSQQVPATPANGAANGTHPPASTAGLPRLTGAILLGQTRTALPIPVELPQEALVRHAAFLGGSGSGKTTLALTLIEQLLLRGIPAILLDRKGDLCSYANP
ncbi:MAG: DUF87 domain-containing protein, partial [Caldilineaceae bacterium]|nr:DUF87 domain-containing protein [Caldilineaceae bacterium]